MAMVERSITDVKWEKAGESAIGRLLAVRKVKYSDGVGLVYLVRDGARLLRFKGATRLNDLLQRGDVGKLIEVRYMGTDGTVQPKPGQSAPKMFRVSVDDDSLDRGVADAQGDYQATDEDIPF